MTNKSLEASGTHRGVEWRTRKSPFYGVNGYMRIPEGHPWRDLTYGEINWSVWEYDTEHLDGGAWELTYKDGAWIGFDTQHACDSWPEMPYSPEPGNTMWTPELVAENARRWCDLIAGEATTVTDDAFETHHSPQEGEIWDIETGSGTSRRCVVRNGWFVPVNIIRTSPYALDDEHIVRKEFIL